MLCSCIGTVLKLVGLLFLLAAGARKRMPHEQRPWHVGPQKDWTTDPL
jgi:hypothetical protein